MPWRNLVAVFSKIAGIVHKADNKVALQARLGFTHTGTSRTSRLIGFLSAVRKNRMALHAAQQQRAKGGLKERLEPDTSRS